MPCWSHVIAFLSMWHICTHGAIEVRENRENTIILRTLNMIMDLIGRAKWIYLRHYQYDAHRNASFSICIFIVSPSFSLHLLIIFVLLISLVCFHFIYLNEDFVCYHMTLIIMCVHCVDVCVRCVARFHIIIWCSSFSFHMLTKM